MLPRQLFAGFESDLFWGSGGQAYIALNMGGKRDEMLVLLILMFVTPVISFRSLQLPLAPRAAPSAYFRVPFSRPAMCSSTKKGKQGGEQTSDVSVKEGKQRLLEVRIRLSDV